MLIRAFTWQDLSAVVRLINRLAKEAGSDRQTSESEQRSLAQLPNRNFEKDRLLAFDAEECFLGYADLWLSPRSEAADLMIAVYPEQWRRGVGTDLLKEITARARGLNARSLVAYADPVYAGAVPFLQHHGFERKGSYRKLSHSALDTLPDATFPKGLYVLTYDKVNEPEILRLALERGYMGLFGHKHPTKETVKRFIADFGKENIVLLFNGKDKVIGCTAIGFLEETPESKKGFMDAPGLEHSYRQTDLYRELALLGLNTLKKAGYAQIELMSWGDAEETIRAYQGIGFRVDKEVPSYELVLDDSA